MDEIKLDSPMVRKISDSAGSTTPPQSTKSYVRNNPYGKFIEIQEPNTPILEPLESFHESSVIERTEFPSRLTIFSPDKGIRSISCPPLDTRYTAISYTWGRFMVRDTRERDTDMAGCYWKIPANLRFTRQELNCAVLKIGSANPVWLDLFCIPQDDNDEEKGIEIKKQAQIFKHAAKAAVWLYEGDDLVQEICSWHFSHYIYEILVIPVSGKFTGETKKRLALLKRLAAEVPWMTSTWTLQESALRSDAAFYDKRGDPILGKSDSKPLTIFDFMRTMSQIEEEMESIRNFEYTMAKEDLDLFTSARKAVINVGLGRLNTMNSQELYRAASFRVCERPHDTVYGIMSAIGVEMEADYNRDMDQLRKDFIVALHNRAPAEMQSFLHFDSCDDGSAWTYQDRDSSLSEIHQLPGENEVIARFQGVLDSGHLVLDTAIILTTEGLAELGMKLEKAEGCLGLDDDGIPRAYYGLDSSCREQQKRSAQSLLNWEDSLALVPLGRLRKQDTWYRVSYMLLSR
ncbi:hypothetical protein BP5796_02085 [Coleophoma crateriformis]|uniref:Heterokaryon incompatibility domain-containing protein n=1 Tax=Coleophoma crateriformis TaxID=565419 RepID=A0A3D8SXC3_9HELO|nr:hypothetical protein BP5796_02085 [Coleophoma crateriformis]